MLRKTRMTRAKKKTTTTDPIREPAHYARREGSLECFDAFVAAHGRKAGIEVCRWSVWKYSYRFDLKGSPSADWEKIRQYAEMALRLDPDGVYENGNCD